jgi:glucose dehydrogenase
MQRSRQKMLTALLLCSLSAVGAAAPADTVPSPPGADWENYNNSLDGQRFSPLSQINAGNVASLAEVCRVRLAARGSLQSGLIVVADAMFVTTPTETFAIDPVTCHIKWQHTYRRRQEPGLQVNRGPAYLNGHRR